MEPTIYAQGNDAVPSQQISADNRSPLTDEQLRQVARVLHEIKKVHVRLCMEGYIVKDGKVRKPNEGL